MALKGPQDPQRFLVSAWLFERVAAGGGQTAKDSRFFSLFFNVRRGAAIDYVARLMERR